MLDDDWGDRYWGLVHISLDNVDGTQGWCRPLCCEEGSDPSTWGWVGAVKVVTCPQCKRLWAKEQIKRLCGVD